MDNRLYDYSPIIERPRLEFPGGARVAFWVGLNIEHYELDKPATSLSAGTQNLIPDPLNYGWRDYSPRVGVWRTMDLLDKFGVKASVLLNSDVCNYYPQIIEEGNKRNWVWLAHGKNNSRLQANMSLDEERKYLTEVIDTIKASTGRQPNGWLGPALSETLNTPQILEELGLSYTCDWCSDDQPFFLNTPQRKMISIPYSIELNDIPLFVYKSMTGNAFYQLLKDHFDVLYAEGAKTGRVMCIALHPFVTGVPFRHKYLEMALDYITSHSKVWVTTSDELANWYIETQTR
ncbi:polysaccharide deacetylase family protein [Alicyclobacillus fastidiosus]|uniref:Polysaccharide deacetylase family protein n=1 Tax=Alicyclobacillus fastidiosus TaxID=392011 RepID=A0ABY6ZKC7_9BACL|nr:polysaccharide deacetylase family protein [Alicyclobacillus fastidiosus]WAH42937.1 polysaccharide deacetylase family protein [Alicyclobacillus fastidiosus]GMA64892.1 polysaccharide deacetylase [Alicyclobacillus fastidiosus]